MVQNKSDRRSEHYSSKMTLKNMFFLLTASCLLMVHLSDARPRNKFLKGFGSKDVSKSLSASSPLFLRDTRNPSTNGGRGGPSHHPRPHLKLRTVPEPELVMSITSNRILECEAGGNPPPSIHWLKNGKKITQNIEEILNDDEEVPQGALGLSFTRSKLFLDCIQPQDEGVYTCVAENDFSRASSDTLVKVVANEPTADSLNSIGTSCQAKKSYGTPARIHMWTKTRLEVIGSEVELFCRSSGFPRPMISWIGPNGDQITSGEKARILENGDLVLRDLSWSDMGGYTCIAANEDGEDQSLTFVYPTAVSSLQNI